MLLSVTYRTSLLTWCLLASYCNSSTVENNLTTILWINWSADREDAKCKYFVSSIQFNTIKKLNILKLLHTRFEKIGKYEGDAKHFSSLFYLQAIFKNEKSKSISVINTETGAGPSSGFLFVANVCGISLLWLGGIGMGLGWLDTIGKESRHCSIKASSISEHPCLPQGPDSKANLRSVGPVSCH